MVNSNSPKLLHIHLLPTRMKKICSKMRELEWSQVFFTCYMFYMFMEIYDHLSRCSRSANSAVHGLIGQNFKLSRDVIDSLVPCKNEEDLMINVVYTLNIRCSRRKDEEYPIKNEGARVLTRFTPL